MSAGVHYWGEVPGGEAVLPRHVRGRRRVGVKDEGQAFGQERFYQVGLWIFVIGFVLFA